MILGVVLVTLIGAGVGYLSYGWIGAAFGIAVSWLMIALGSLECWRVED